MGKGGGSSSTTTVDPVYNAGMLAISEEQQGMAAEMFNMFKYGVTYDPNEQVESGEVERTWVPGQEAEAPPMSGKLRDNQGGGGLATPGYFEETPIMTTRGELEGFDPDAQVSEMDYLQNIVEANQSLLGLQTKSQKKRLELSNTYTDDINRGIDVNARMNEAGAGVQHAFKNANRASRMDIASYGLDPGAGRYASQNRDRAIAEASGVAGARTEAKNFAEREDFQRKTTGLQIS